MEQKPLQKLFTKSMNRREFLAHIGAGLLTVVGVSGLISSLVNLNGKPTERRSSGYGSSGYGGSKAAKQ